MKPQIISRKEAVNKVMQQIFNHDLSRVKAYMAKNEGYTDKQLDAMEIEYKKFIAIAATAEKPTPVSEIVDPMWHNHILFTKDYHAFSKKAGKEYIHHSPTVTDDEVAQLRTAYLENTIEVYKECFGSVNTQYWAVEGQICINCCFTND